jgi:glycosyltransferase involved in cell wall biosynthesis
MRFILYSPLAFEKWDYRNLEKGGIGGSETSHIEMALRLAKRGHEVISYCPIPDDCPVEYGGVMWFDVERANWTTEGTWIIYRSPKALDNLVSTEHRSKQKIWFLMQDWDYSRQWTTKRILNCDRILALSQCQVRNLLKKNPEAKGRIFMDSNGINVERLTALESSQKIVRNPKKIIYTSSPDRGLRAGLLTFKKAYRMDPELQFHCFYGFKNFDKVMADEPSKRQWYNAIKTELLELLKLPGVYWHDRVDQVELYRQWMESGIWLYITNFPETSCISCMEAQAMGAIPVLSPVYAQGENTNFGIQISGEPDEPLTHARAAMEVVNLANNETIQNDIRKAMMPWARDRYDWEKMVDLWEARAEDKSFPHPFPLFQ